MRWLSTVEGISSTAAAGVTLTLGFSLGILLLRWFQPLPIHVDSFLVGSLTTVNAQDVWFVGALVVVSLGVLVAFRRTLVSFYFDQTSFRAQGGNPGCYDLLTLTLISVTMVVVIPAVGTILSLALLVAPAAALQPRIKRPTQLMLGAGIAGIALACGGLWLAAALSLSAGGCIAVLAGVFYLLSMGLRALL